MKLLILVPVLLAAPFFAATPAPATATAAPAAGDAWTVDPVHSSVVFRLQHGGVTPFYGTFEAISGTVTLDPAAPEKGAVELVIPVASLRTRDAKRDGHLQGPDFFNGKENPDIRFRSTAIAKSGDGAYAVKGTLDMAGKQHAVELTVHDGGDGEMMGKVHGWSAEFSIKRSDFGMNYGIAQKALSDEVTVMIGLEGRPAK